eukprot:515590-Amphidinium_carterae.1
MVESAPKLGTCLCDEVVEIVCELCGRSRNQSGVDPLERLPSCAPSGPLRVQLQLQLHPPLHQ